MGSKILLVEDNEMNRDMLSRRLALRSYEVLFAVTGEEAVHMAASSKPDLILMDLSLPVMDGWEATRKIRQEEQGKKVPIIALTAHALQSDRDRALAAGCNDFDTKPVDMKRLLSKMEVLLTV